MQEGNPHLTAEHPLEAIPRNYREACIEGYADLGLHRIVGEFRRIVEAERRRTEPKAKSRPKSPQAKARPAEPKKAKAKSRPKSPQAKARPAESKKAKAPATAKKTKPPAAATVEKAEAPEPPVKRAPEAFRGSGVWLGRIRPRSLQRRLAQQQPVRTRQRPWRSKSRTSRGELGARHRHQLRPRWRQQLRRL